MREGAHDPRRAPSWRQAGRRSISTADMLDTARDEADLDALLRDWSLTEGDLREIHRARGEGRLWTALHVCSLRRTGRFVDDAEPIPHETIVHLANQIGIDPPVRLTALSRQPTDSAIRAQVPDYLGFAAFSAEAETRLMDSFADERPSFCRNLRKSRDGRGRAALFCYVTRDPVEAEENLSPQLATLVGDDPVCKVAPRIDESQSELNGWSIRSNVVGVHEVAYRAYDLTQGSLITAREHPHEFAKRRRGDSDQGGSPQRVRGRRALDRVVPDGGPNQHVCVSNDLQRAPAQPAAANAFMSSTDIGLSPSWARDPMKSSIRPLAAARTSALPPGSKSTTRRSPACTPRWSRTERRRVTCPLAVTVSIDSPCVMETR